MTAECRRVIRNWLGSKMTDDSYSNAIVDVVREGVEMLLRGGLNPREENWIQFIPELVEKALPAVAVR